MYKLCFYFLKKKEAKERIYYYGIVTLLRISKFIYMKLYENCDRLCFIENLLIYCLTQKI